MMDMSQVALDARCDTLLLGRLGRELARVYHDSLNAPVPARLQALIDQIGQDGAPASGARQPREGR